MSLITYNIDAFACPEPFIGSLTLNDVCVANGTALFLSLLNIMVVEDSTIGSPCGRVEPVAKPKSTYDFIVVGGGAAGSIIAARLSEVPTWKVLLVEAGPDEPAGAEIPSNLQLYLNTELDWKYETTNESFACLNNGGRCHWPRGKNLGGCTSHHGMAYHRGHAKDYERWAEMGNKGWSWDDVFPYFLKSEDNTEIGRVSEKYHATGGMMTVQRFPSQPAFAWDILEAAKEQGFGVSEDLVGDQITGFTVAQTLSKDGVRQSTPAAYLRPIRHRQNLDVLLNAQVIGLRTTGQAKVTGIRYLMNGKTRTVRARREVIVSAGTINSPQLLLLSGIGPKEHLESVGIRTVRNLPGVGENLHNHLSFGLDFTVDEPNKNELNIESADLYIYNRTGPLSCTGLAQVTGVLPSSYTTADDPDIQIFFAGYQAICETGGRIADLGTYGDKETVRFTSVNLQPLSRGRITLRDKDPLSYPVIWSNELSNPQDVSILVEGIHVILSLANSTTMKSRGLTLASPEIAECADYEYLSDDYLRCAIHWNTRPENHQSGTCKMGPATDPMAVVDPTLKVHGVKGLRVADASVMPKVVSGNPVAAINMIGERAADFIKKDWGIRIE